MAITGGFGFTFDIESGVSRPWSIGSDGIKRWADSGDPVENTQSDKKIGIDEDL